jgi:hypothetical protein
LEAALAVISGKFTRAHLDTLCDWQHKHLPREVCLPAASTSQTAADILAKHLCWMREECVRAEKEFSFSSSAATVSRLLESLPEVPQ